ncbi:MAG: hypothetical protein ACI3Z7_06440 [Candidatus Aphodosoma sp.]
MLLSDFTPELKLGPEHPYTCIVQLWTTESLDYAGVKTKEQVWNMSDEEKFALRNQLSAELFDKPENSPLNIESEYLYEHMTAIIHNYPGMGFKDGNENEMMLDDEGP